MKYMQALSVLVIFSLGMIIPGCETFCEKCYCDNMDAQDLPLNTNFEMKFGEAYCNPDHWISLTFASFQEGRCPTGVICVWEGNAQVTFSLEDKKEGDSEFVLNTNDVFRTDTTIHGLRFELIGLEPYPDIDEDYPEGVYTATVLISE